MDVLFRSCSRIYAVHGGHRVVNASKSEIILRCLNSLVISMNQVGGSSSTEVSLTIIDDHSEPRCVQGMKDILSQAHFPTHLIPMQATGNGASLLQNYEHAREHFQDLIYFVEDDYLHSPDAILSLLHGYQQVSFFIKQDVVLFPCDYPNLYINVLPTRVVLGESCYWRNITHTTATTLVSKKTLLEYWPLYMKLTNYQPGGLVNEDNSINLIYNSVPCFSPMPTLAVHLSGPKEMSPLVNWITWWEKSAVQKKTTSRFGKTWGRLFSTKLRADI